MYLYRLDYLSPQARPMEPVTDLLGPVLLRRYDAALQRARVAAHARQCNVRISRHNGGPVRAHRDVHPDGTTHAPDPGPDPFTSAGCDRIFR